jgi:hypothetical protein
MLEIEIFSEGQRGYFLENFFKQKTYNLGNTSNISVT